MLRNYCNTDQAKRKYYRQSFLISLFGSLYPQLRFHFEQFGKFTCDYND